MFRGSAIRCEVCQTEDFWVSERAFNTGFICEDCQLVFCGRCCESEEREEVEEIRPLICPMCRTRSIRLF